MLVRDVMTTGVMTAKKDHSLRSVITKMISRHCGSVPVVDDDNTLIGVVTLRDVLLPLYPNLGDYIHDNVHSRDFVEMEEGYPKVMEMKVGEVMTANPFTVSPDDPVLKAASYMGLKNLRHIPVTENGTLLGVITISDINQGLFFAQ
ncbi:MAG: hypothetical protein BMS9Abin18_1239 [Zetaproteobacteria bacterium]|nr:MAG: hypothetical protein BMS9Abin18_1239 [Zetaproteobacteria bacterium]